MQSLRGFPEAVSADPSSDHTVCNDIRRQQRRVLSSYHDGHPNKNSSFSGMRSVRLSFCWYGKVYCATVSCRKMPLISIPARPLHPAGCTLSVSLTCHVCSSSALLFHCVISPINLSAKPIASLLFPSSFGNPSIMLLLQSIALLASQSAIVLCRRLWCVRLATLQMSANRLVTLY
jgi:hypothetical protein